MPRPRLYVQPLEPRDAPAALAGDNRSLTYRDTDGDLVRVTLSRPLPADVGPADVFQFDTGEADDDPDTRQQLQRIDLAAIGRNGVSVTVAATAADGGNGAADVGEVIGEGFDVGTVQIDGDLGRVTAGNERSKTPGLKLLAVGSLGARGTTTGAADLVSAVLGRIGRVKVAGDLMGARISARGGESAAGLDRPQDGSIGKVTVGGDLVGIGANTGVIESTAGIGDVTIGGDLVGGTGQNSGQIEAGLGNVGAVLIRGDVVGGAGAESASVRAVRGSFYVPNPAYDPYGGGGYGGGGYDYEEPYLTITRGGAIKSVTVRGAVTGDAAGSAAFTGDTRVGAVTLGSLTGGAGAGSGGVTAGGGNIGAVTIRGDLRGGAGEDSGQFRAVEAYTYTDPYAPPAPPRGGRVVSVAIGGDVVGVGPGSASVVADRAIGPAAVKSLTGGAAMSGGIFAGKKLGPVTVTGDVRGGAGAESAMIRGSSVAGVTIGGDMVGGVGPGSAVIAASGGSLGPVLIRGDLRGGAGVGSASISAYFGYVGGDEYGYGRRVGGRITAVSVGGDVVGDAAQSGQVRASAKVGAVAVGSLTGGTGDESAGVFGASIGSMTVTRSVEGGAGGGSAAIVAELGSIESVRIGGDLKGGTGAGSAAVSAAQGTRDEEGPVIGGRIGAVSVRGSVIGVGPDSASIAADKLLAKVAVGGDLVGGAAGSAALAARAGSIGTIQIKGGIRGGTGARSAAITAIRNEETGGGGKIGSVTVGGSVAGGAGIGSADVVADLAVGTVFVKEGWSRASIAAGFQPGPDGFFDTADDVRMAAGTIAAIRVGITPEGTDPGVSAGDKFAFLANRVLALKIGPTPTALLAGPANDDLVLGSSGDFRLVETA